MASVLCPQCGKSNLEFSSRCFECGAVLPYASEAGLQSGEQDPTDGTGIESGETDTEKVTVQEADALVGQTVSHYQVLERLGAGGMGVVYRASDTLLRRAVALKFLPAKLCQSPAAKARFMREAHAASALDDSNIGTIHEIAEHDGQLFIVMAYYEGQTLQQRIQRGGPLPLAEAESVLRQLALALSAAHGAGIVHRDLKPANVMLIERRTGGMEPSSPLSARSPLLVKLLDFGLVKLVADSESGEMSLTEAGQVLGTVAYMSPEQARGEAVDHRTDLWSLGVVAYEMLTGASPYHAPSKTATLTRILHEEPRPLRELRDDVPPALEHLVSRLLCKNPGQRLQSTEETLQALDRSDGPGGGLLPAPAQQAGRAGVMKRLSVRHALIFAVVVTVLAAGFALDRLVERNKPIDSLAVLPFVNASANPDAEYLSDGITESLINGLSQLPNLRVMSRNSVFRYKGKETDVQAAASGLGVRAVLMGRISQREDRLLVSVELVDARDHSQLWGEQYNRKLADILAVQAEIAREISERLRLELTREARKGLSRSYTENAEAYHLYLRGRYHWHKLPSASFRKSREYFQQAIDLDPTYAPAYAGLADFYSLSAARGWLPDGEAWPKAEAAARKALKIDPALGEAHIPLADVKLYYHRDWPGAERELKRAIELNPNSADAHGTYARSLIFFGRADEAIAQANRAMELDPLSLRWNFNLGWIFYLLRQYDRAIEQYRKTIELDSNDPLARYWLAIAYEKKGMYEEAFAERRQAMPLGGEGELVPIFERAYTESGYSGAAKVLSQKLIEKFNEQAKRGQHVPAMMFVWAYERLGDMEQAFAWLEKAAQERNRLVFEFRVDPLFDSLRSDPRYAEIFRRHGLPP